MLMDEIKVNILLRRKTEKNFIVKRLTSWGKEEEEGKRIEKKDIPKEAAKDHLKE